MAAMLLLLHMLTLLQMIGVFADTPPPEAISVSQGSSVTLKCELPFTDTTIALVTVGPCQTPNAAVFTDSEAHLQEQFQDKFSLAEKYGLTLKSAECSDAGDYCCAFTIFPQGRYDSRILLTVTGC